MFEIIACMRDFKFKKFLSLRELEMEEIWKFERFVCFKYLHFREFKIFSSFRDLQ